MLYINICMYVYMYVCMRSNWSSITAPESIVFPPLEKAVKEYQDPTKADKISKIKKDLDETTDILVCVCYMYVCM